MAIELENVLPSEIEKRSFEIITEELTQSGIVLDPEKAPVIKRCIHTSADFDYAQNLYFRKMQLHVQKKQSVMEHPL